MKTLNLFSALILALSLGACSEKSDEKKSAPMDPDVLIPNQLEYTKPNPGVRLTKEQATEMKKLFTNRSTLNLPPGALVFPRKDMSAAERVQKQAQLAKEDPASFQLLMDLKANCDIKSHEPQVRTNLPTDNSIKSFDQLKVGDYVELSNSDSLKGSNCPADYSSDGFGRLMVDFNESTQEKANLALSAKLNQKIDLRILKEEYAQKLKSRGLIVDGEISGLSVVKTGPEGGKWKVLAKFNMGGAYYTLENSLPYKTENEFLLITSSDKQASQLETLELITRTEIVFPNFKAALENHYQIAGNKVVVSETYVNGHLMSEVELQELFGDFNQNSVETTRKLVQGLNL